ncbi:MAG: MFS transporter [Candidatus Odinarchaeota archaeon]
MVHPVKQPFFTFFSDFRDYNWNVKVAFISALFSSIGFGALFGNLFSIFVMNIGGSEFLLGLTATLGGLASTVILFPAGYLVDRWRRDALIWASQLLAITGILAIVFAPDIQTIFLGNILLGLSQGAGGPAIEALIADSTKTGNRSQVYSQLFFVRTAGSAIGPFFNVLLFFILGDTWGLETLRQVMMISAVFAIIGSAITLLAKDSASLGAESEVGNGQNGVEGAKSDFFMPLVLVASGIVIGFGAGMTVQFFPVFFKEVYGQLPIIVNLVFGLTYIVTGSSGILAQKVSRWIGRLETMFVFQAIAVIALVVIITYPPLMIMFVAYIIRNAFMNASNPLGRTIVMDKIAKKHRGRFNSLEQLAWGFLWSFSAGIGGFILETTNGNFVIVFSITATLYTIATLPLVFLRKYVEKEAGDSVTDLKVAKRTVDVSTGAD